MGLLKIIDKKFDFSTQRRYLISFLFFGVPVGYLMGQGISIWTKGWDKYNFSIGSLLFSLSIDLLIMSPLIVNYFIQRKKFNLIIKKFHKTICEQSQSTRPIGLQTSTLKVKASLPSKEFKEGEVYDIQILSHTYAVSKWYRPNTLFLNSCDILIINKNKWRSTNNFYDIINKFELVDSLKEERKKKLERLQKAIK